MTRDEQTTERALVQAQVEWLLARGWQPTGAPTISRGRWQHPAGPHLPALTMADAMTFSRAEPLRYRRGS